MPGNTPCSSSGPWTAASLCPLEPGYLAPVAGSFRPGGVFLCFLVRCYDHGCDPSSGQLLCGLIQYQVAGSGMQFSFPGCTCSFQSQFAGSSIVLLVPCSSLSQGLCVLVSMRTTFHLQVSVDNVETILLFLDRLLQTPPSLWSKVYGLHFFLSYFTL